MKKIVIGIPLAFLSALALMVAWVNFAPSEDAAAEENPKTEEVTQQEVSSEVSSVNVAHLQPENLQPKEEVIYAEEQMKNPKSEAYQINITDYGTLQQYLNKTSGQWHTGKEWGGGDPEIDRKIAIAAIAIDHVNYYQEEIQERGLVEEFDELQLAAFDIASSFRDVSEEELRAKFKIFEDKLETLKKSGK